MTAEIALPQLAAVATNERATPSLVYRALLRSIREGLMVPGAKLPNERELASFAYPDGRDKVWFWVPLSALAEVTGLTAEQLLRAGDEA